MSERVLFQHFRAVLYLFIAYLDCLKPVEINAFCIKYFQSGKWFRNLLKIKDYTQIKPEVFHFLKALFTQSVRSL